jgi:hypothetical protein
MSSKLRAQPIALRRRSVHDELSTSAALSSPLAADNPLSCCIPNGSVALCLVGYQQDASVKEKNDVRQGRPALMVLQTLDVLGPLHGYGIARRKELLPPDPHRTKVTKVESRDWEQTVEIIGRFFALRSGDL